jgi:hypothetical protein
MMVSGLVPNNYVVVGGCGLISLVKKYLESRMSMCVVSELIQN